ncbi:polysaccharide deacetylase family protein [Thermoflavimicrobium daqui]|uniref:NodB homology domain-containing protein n=1 Tax=Thermoflavimicrobium daqui TaxID=2137476 RepID=A0A364K7R4_9BACL|nr:polysaccharide deacetylase family protein [Thermoflavimicrobium daqui]RAL26339.1 hypothetical protein DL897_04915 [Thermoflavimicrobium daqui]
MKVFLLTFALFFSFTLIQSDPVTAYVQAVKQDQSFPILKENDITKLRERIQQEAPSKYIAPIDARVDRIWKGIPGLNGREVDIEATIRKTLKQKKNKEQIQWVYKKLLPQKSLDDLGAVPIYRGNENKKAAALMINVAWGTEYLPQMLKILKQEQVTATFFLDGSWLKKHPEEAKKIVMAGHEIGNHAYSHPLLSRMTQGRIEREIAQTNQLIKQTLKLNSSLFAPPAGDFDQRVVDIAHQHKMRTILWTVDTVDWRKDSTPDKMVARIEKGVSSGSLILTHPTDRTVVALPQIIRSVKRKGIKWITVGSMLSSKRLEEIE